MALPLLIPLASAGAAWVGKDLVEIFGRDEKPAGSQAIYPVALAAPSFVTLAVYGAAAYGAYQVFKKVTR